MDIVDLPTESLVPYANNARRNAKAVKAVAASIKEFGFKQPIVVDSNHEVIAGHTRLRAATQLGLATVPVVIASDLTEAQIKAYRLADNKTAELAQWDYDMLKVELSDLINIDFDMQDFGFSFEVLEHEPKENRLRTDSAYNLDKINSTDCFGDWEMPIIANDN